MFATRAAFGSRRSAPAAVTQLTQSHVANRSEMVTLPLYHRYLLQRACKRHAGIVRKGSYVRFYIAA